MHVPAAGAACADRRSRTSSASTFRTPSRWWRAPSSRSCPSCSSSSPAALLHRRRAGRQREGM